MKENGLLFFYFHLNAFSKVFQQVYQSAIRKFSDNKYKFRQEAFRMKDYKLGK